MSKSLKSMPKNEQKQAIASRLTSKMREIGTGQPSIMKASDKDCAVNKTMEVKTMVVRMLRKLLRVIRDGEQNGKNNNSR